jgi:flagellar motor switch protein FliM
MADEAGTKDTPEMSEDERLAAEWAAEVTEETEEGDASANGEGDDALAAEWGAMAEEEEGGTAPQTNRVLNQDEIDSLLGFDDDSVGSGDSSGLKAIVNSALVSYERLPMLEVIYDRLVRMMSTSLRNFTSDNVEVSFDNITSIRFGDYLNSIPLPAMLAVFKAEEWDNYGLITVESGLIYAIVDVLLGGRRGSSTLRVEGRPYTTIERDLVERMIRVMLDDMSAAFAPLSAINFRYDRLETNPRFATIARPANAAILARLRIDMEDRGGRVELLFPYSTIEPVRDLLLQMFMGEKFGHDPIWEKHLASELWRTHVDMKAILDEVSMPLSKVLDLKVGSRLMLNAKPDSLVSLHGGKGMMFDGRMGCKGKNLAVRIENYLSSTVKSP